MPPTATRRQQPDIQSQSGDLRQFHEVVLTNGAVPLDILEELVNAWVKSKA